ncbi:unnamed protein product [Gongylonema pulchrum]|uniref:G_PROTEIN_RECEP_F1_2 domain-containing protein n=1 Tax=Gongylonema pulchrum TaxID=637853 RepID=A0A183E0S0_9BILA|nr:unnamed protein product [Gongylonema pulchrum]
MTSVYLQQFYYLLLYPNLGWILINTICALLALVVKIAIRVTVGPVSAQESAVLGDRVGNFLVYKAVFLFGVLNSVEYEEAVAWILWFASLAAVAALQSILTYRLKYLMSSFPPRKVLLRIMALSIVLLVVSVAFVSFAFSTFRLFSLSIALFILADTIIIDIAVALMCLSVHANIFLLVQTIQNKPSLFQAIKPLLGSIYLVLKCAALLDNAPVYFSSLEAFTEKTDVGSDRNCLELCKKRIFARAARALAKYCYRS